MPRGKCVQKRAFVAKFVYLWRNLAFFVAKKGEKEKELVEFPYF